MALLNYTAICAFLISLCVFAAQSAWENKRLESVLLLVFSVILNMLLLSNLVKTTGETAQLTWYEFFGKQDSESPIIQLRTQEAMQALIAQSAHKPLVIKISSIGCPPCTQLKPIFRQVAQELRETVTFAEIEFIAFDRPEALGIKGIPTLIYCKNGQEIKRTTGFVSSEQIKNELLALA